MSEQSDNSLVMDDFDVESDTGGFVAVPLRALTVVGTEARVLQCYVMLLALADDRGRCHPSHAHIAKKMGCSKSAVRRSIDTLRDLGLLRKQGRRRTDEGSDGRQTSNQYLMVRHIKPGVLTGEQGGAHQGPGAVVAGDQPIPRASDLDPPSPPSGRRCVCGEAFADINDYCEHIDGCAVYLEALDEGGTPASEIPTLPAGDAFDIADAPLPAGESVS